MLKIDFQRCTDCDGKGIFKGGGTCGRCQGLGYLPVADDEEDEDLPEPLRKTSDFLTGPQWV